jgi:hypothetical protein
MAWDTTKIAGDDILSSEWNAMVTDQKTRVTTGAGLKLAYTALVGTTTLGASHFLVNCTANSFVVNLPTAVGISGTVYVIKNTGLGTITITPNGAENIDGSATLTLATGKVYGIASNGANWIVIFAV